MAEENAMTPDPRPLSAAGLRLLEVLGGTDDPDYRSPTANMIAAIEDEALDAERARHAALVAAATLTADWLAAIIAESDPKPSELMAMEIALRAALDETPK
jgi:hypothetical protein